MARQLYFLLNFVGTIKSGIVSRVAQKRSGIVGRLRFDCSADISIALIAISQCRNDDIIDSITVFIVPLLSR